jgi:anti-sigma B factor antagonist
MQMPDNQYPVEVVRGVPVVTAAEEIDITNADGLQAALLEAAARGHATLVVDMARTQFCDTAGIHVLVGAHKRALTEGGQLRLVISSANVLRVFAITGINRVIPQFASLDEALAQISRPTRRPGSGRDPSLAEPSPPPVR